MQYLKSVTQKPIPNPDPDAVYSLNGMTVWVSTVVKIEKVKLSVM
jgi:hypothetical protein